MNATLLGAAGNGMYLEHDTDFVDEYVARHGNEKFLNLISKYGPIISKISILCDGGIDQLNDEKLVEKKLRDEIYKKILNGSLYTNLINVPEFVTEHPDIFLSLKGINTISDNQKKEILQKYYSGNLTFDDIKQNPELVNLLRDKNLKVAFRNIGNSTRINGRRLIIAPDLAVRMGDNDLQLLNYFDNDTFLNLCLNYGKYLSGILRNMSNNKDLLDKINSKSISYEELCKNIEDIIAKECVLGNTSYSPEDAPIFLRENHPELFLSDDAPEELKERFYSDNKLTFAFLSEHKEWLPYLKNKAVSTALLRNPFLKQDRAKYLSLFGEEKAIKLGISRTETVEHMIANHKVEFMKAWYDKTGGKFIPDYVVMQNFPLEQADKFLMSGSNWSKLMRIKSFAELPESREAMLKLAYVFGTFDGDTVGFKKLQTLLTDIPRTISSDYEHLINSISLFDQNDEISQRINDMFGNEFMGKKEYDQLKNVLISEGFNVNEGQEIFSQIYKKNEDGSYTLTINPQSYPKSSELIRKLFEIYPMSPIVTPNLAHQLFGSFDLKYDPEFREFLLKNLDEIIAKPEYASAIASIQKQWQDIKINNSNRTLTLELAVSYVKSNQFTSVELGNERVAEISAIAGYTQTEFDTLQQIYNYGKQRTFSSIPRIEKSSGKYKYEMLRLDDPLAMAIGTLSDCCQEIGNCAEVCMEHSMVDKNGRVFVIRDEKGNVVAQSWVWRNKDVLCFDNIEIPDKAFSRAIRENPQQGRKGFTEEIYNIYKQAAQDLIDADEHVYKELLDAEKITQEEYDGLRLGKVTVGLGYNDIASAIKTNSKEDKGQVSRPLHFDEPVRLTRSLYTHDSETQYVLEERKNRVKYEGETIPVHYDTYQTYTGENFTEKELLYLKRLELLTKNNSYDLETELGDNADEKQLFAELARNYGLNPRNSKIIMNSNFAILYDESGNKVNIAELLYNLQANINGSTKDISDVTIMQIRMALDQIAKNKNVNISSLSDEQKEIYQKAMSLGEEIDIERGVGHAK